MSSWSTVTQHPGHSSVLSLAALMLTVASCSAGPHEQPAPEPATDTIREPLLACGVDTKYVGGGEFYDELDAGVADATVTVTTEQELLNALGDASSGDVIYVADDVVIGVTVNGRDAGLSPFVVGQGVTLASGRGRLRPDGSRSLGGTISLGTLVADTLIVVDGPNVRISGLRLRGPGGQIVDAGAPAATGITVSADAGDLVTIDNCEFSGWAQAAINAKSSGPVHIHHNHIHHNDANEWPSAGPDAGFQEYNGYGVVLGSPEYKPDSGAYPLVTIEDNLFSHNRHDIAASGLWTTSFDARHNLCTERPDGLQQEGWRDHRSTFDTHGCYDKLDTFYKTCKRCIEDVTSAGDRITIEENVFLDQYQYAYRIRGIPREGASVINNCFRHDSGQGNEGLAALQQDHADATTTAGTDDCGEAAGCNDGDSSTPCRAEAKTNKGTWTAEPKNFTGVTVSADGGSEDTNHYAYQPGSAWFVSYGGTEPWKFRRFSPYVEPTAVAFGRFLGWDQAQDAFIVTPANGEYRWGISSAAMADPQLRTSHGIAMNQLAFGDFGGDQRTDLFTSNGGFLKTWITGESGWTDYATSGVALSELAVGDFDGDGLADVFRRRSKNIGGVVTTTWQVSYNGYDPSNPSQHPVKGGVWSALYTDPGHTPLGELRFGTFSKATTVRGLDPTDVFRRHQIGSTTYWQVWSPATASWQNVGSSSTPLEDMRFCDFNGDGGLDIFRRTGSSSGWWQVSYWSEDANHDVRYGRWTNLRIETIETNELAFADVNGDGRCDILASRKPW